ncbi:uncharacterized protein TNCV_821071 [Trichonephila clavipes]|nr:uncharacterized protein TNCV_821071 [Trichonephila clavipes]
MASEKMKTRYDATATGHDFHEGDKVWLWNPKRRKGLSPKLQMNWEGPYTVLKRLNDVVVRTEITTLKTEGNHQMARIVRHNDESVREGYIRNGGKEVKLFTSALRAFQCNNSIVMAHRKHLDVFLRDRIIGPLECGLIQLEVSEELGIAQSVISRLWQRFQDDSNGSRCYSIGRPQVTTPNEDRYLAVTAKRNRRSAASDLFHQLLVRQFQGKPCTDA